MPEANGAESWSSNVKTKNDRNFLMVKQRWPDHPEVWSSSEIEAAGLLRREGKRSDRAVNQKQVCGSDKDAVGGKSGLV